MSQGDDSYVGMTGARFGGGGRRRRRRTAAEPITQPLPPVPGGEPVEGHAAGLGRTGARFGGQTRSDGLHADDPAALPEPVDAPEEGFEDEPGFEEDGEEIAHIAVRPYVLTGGRTRPAVELAIEALVSLPAGSSGADHRPDHAAVLALCRTPRSVAEIAALMQVALGVARVLVGDLAESGAVVVHRTSGAAGPDLALLERVLGGLRRL